MQLSFGMLLYLYEIRPYSDPFLNLLEFINESTLLICFYMLLPLELAT